MKTIIYTLVYQGGIANVFEEFPRRDLRTEVGVSSERIRLLQSDFQTAVTFCRGLRKAGAIVRAAWCNEAGDIKNSFWHFAQFNNAPFSEKFAKDFVSDNVR